LPGAQARREEIGGAKDTLKLKTTWDQGRDKKSFLSIQGRIMRTQRAGVRSETKKRRVGLSEQEAKPGKTQRQNLGKEYKTPNRIRKSGRRKKKREGKKYLEKVAHKMTGKREGEKKREPRGLGHPKKKQIGKTTSRPRNSKKGGKRRSLPSKKANQKTTAGKQEPPQNSEKQSPASPKKTHAKKQ